MPVHAEGCLPSGTRATVCPQAGSVAAGCPVKMPRAGSNSGELLLFFSAVKETQVPVVLASGLSRPRWSVGEGRGAPYAPCTDKSAGFPQGGVCFVFAVKLLAAAKRPDSFLSEAARCAK